MDVTLARFGGSGLLMRRSGWLGEFSAASGAGDQPRVACQPEVVATREAEGLSRIGQPVPDAPLVSVVEVDETLRVDGHVYISLGVNLQPIFDGRD